MRSRPASGSARPTTSRLAQVLSLLCLVQLAVTPPHAYANLPSGAQVVQGNVNITQSGGAMNIRQTSQNAIVNWQSFNIGTGNTVKIAQNGTTAAMLARVVGNDPSKLLGSLKADGKLFLINSRGILVGEGAVIDTAAFLASTLDVSDDAFLRGGALTLKGKSDAAVVNLGTITAREGNVFLFAHAVKNDGAINAAKGTAGLGAGTEVLLASPETGEFVIKTNLSSSKEKSGVENSGVIAAAQAQLEAAGGSIYELAVNQSGVVRATGVKVKNGRVLLTADGGTVGVSGEISAQNKDGSGGEILVGGDFRGQNDAIANADRTVVTKTGKLDASAANKTSAAGRVIVWSDDATRFLGTLKATGAGGGFAEVSGKRFLDFNPRSAVQLGKGGTLLLDPDALVVSTASNSGTSTSGSDPYVFGASTEPAVLNVTTLQNQLAVSNVVLDTSTSTGDITFDAPVTWTTNNALTVRSGNNININADITGGADSTLALYVGRDAEPAPESGNPWIRGEGTLDENATITVGTLLYGANGDSAPQHPHTISPEAGYFFTYGNLNVGTLELDLTHGSSGVTTMGSNNAIGAFRTTGTHGFSARVIDHQGDLDVTFKAANQEGTYFEFVTPGTLTLKSGSSASFTTPGTVILASTGDSFVNEAGADVFGTNARFLIYSNTTSATLRGGLTGTEMFNHAYDENDYFDDEISRFFYTAASGSPILTYTANDFSRAYGSANPTFTYTRTGLIQGVLDDVTGKPALSTTATQSSGVGTYAINIAIGTLASSNYDFEFVPGTLTIQKAPLTITADNFTRRVNLANPTFTASYSGFVLGQNASALSGTLSFSTSATAASPAGAYAITPSGLTSANYAITFVPGSLNVVNTVPLLITANDFSRLYGAANPTFTASYSGFVGGENASIVTGLKFSTTATQSSGVGTYAITPFGATAPGYDISYANGTLTIERAPLTISVPGQSRYYGDANNFTVNFNGLVNGDTSDVVSGLKLTSTATKTSGVGNYTITASGASAANYTITYSNGTLSVLPAPLTITFTNTTRHYGDADPVFGFTVSGLKNGDSASLVHVDNIGSLATAQSGVGSYGIIGSAWTTSANYTVPAQVTGSLTITPRPLTITANSFTRVYGDANPTLTATFDGLASFDTPALFGDIGLTTQATKQSGVGNWGITFSTVTNPNYAITAKFGTLTITPALLTFDALIDVSRLYGHADPTLLMPALDGLKNADTVQSLGLQFSGVPAATADVGRYTYTVTSNNPNYTFVAPTAEFRIDPAPIQVALSSVTRTYGDTTQTGYELRASGLAFDHTAESVLSVLNPTTELTNVGVYTFATTLLNQNYYIESLSGGEIVILPAPLTIWMKDATRTDMQPNPTFETKLVIGLRNNDTLESIGTTFWTDATHNSSPGSYVINATVDSPNYETTVAPGTLLITPQFAVNDISLLLDPEKLNQGEPGNFNVNITQDEEVTVEKEKELTIAVNPDVDFYTKPLTHEQYAIYFGSYFDRADELRSSMVSAYEKLLSGKGQADSRYEQMSPEARELLDGWMDGSLSPASIQALVSAGNAAALDVFSLMLPSLIEFTRDKNVEEMTMLDRQLLGRLADLTEQRRSETVLIAQKKYAAMLEENARRAEMNGLANIFVGPGDFKNIVESATQEALGAYIGATGQRLWSR